MGAIITNSGKGAAKTTTALQPGGANGPSFFQRFLTVFNTPYVPKGGDFATKTFAQHSTIPQGQKPVPKPIPIPTGAVNYHSASEMKFNLPPHNWSLPINLTTVTGNVDANYTDHSMRRAMMWYYDTAKASKDTTGIIPPTNTGADTTNNGAIATPQDNYWGFQFLWNPTDLTSTLTRNANVVPSSLDSFAALAGLFTAMENIQFTIVIDRVNDFACFRANPSQAPYHTEFYGASAGVQQNTSALITNLMKQGTMSDIEFIYKMINGSGQNGKLWQNGLNRVTSDLAFLSPTAVALQLGPTADSLSYIGWFESLTIKHSVFTEDMIPIHSEVTVSFNAFSRVALTS
jgi:hypothetical protein